MDKKDDQKPLIFISYAREDIVEAVRLSEVLKLAGFDTWIDQERLLPGQYWPIEIRKAIKSCDYFIALLSLNSVPKRGFVQRELKQALDVIEELPEYEKYLIPVRLHDCDTNYEILQRIHWVDLFPYWEVGVNKLVFALRAGKKFAPGSARRVSSKDSSEGATWPAPIASSSIGVNFGLPPEIVSQFLGLDSVSRSLYRNSILKGIFLFLIVLLILVLAVQFGFEFSDTKTFTQFVFAAFCTFLMFCSGYFLVSGVSRWRMSYRVRKAIVARNDTVVGFIQSEHRWIWRFFFGPWYWKLAFLAIRLIAFIVFLPLAFLAAIAIFALFKRDWFGLVALAVVAAPLGGLVWPTLKFIRLWKTLQRMAGLEVDTGVQVGTRQVS